MNAAPLLHSEKDDFTKCTKYLSKVLATKLPKSAKTEFLFNIVEFFTAKKRSKGKTTFKQFTAAVTEYISLTVSLCQPGDDFQELTMNNGSHSILNGCCVTRYAVCPCEKNRKLLDGLFMDTTWKVLRLYVTSIFMCSICNVGILVAIAFGSTETKELYQIFYDTLMSAFHIDLSVFIVESDQGSALKLICQSHHGTYLVCLRHLLVSLKTREFSCELGNLV
jgi:hypothetical protein